MQEVHEKMKQVSEAWGQKLYHYSQHVTGSPLALQPPSPSELSPASSPLQPCADARWTHFAPSPVVRRAGWWLNSTHWQPYGCRLRHFTPSQFVAMFAGRSFRLMGDSNMEHFASFIEKWLHQDQAVQVQTKGGGGFVCRTAWLKAEPRRGHVRVCWRFFRAYLPDKDILSTRLFSNKLNCSSLLDLPAYGRYDFNLVHAGVWPLSHHSEQQVYHKLIPGLRRAVQDCKSLRPPPNMFWIDTFCSHAVPGPGAEASWPLLSRTVNIHRFTESVRRSLSPYLAGAIPAFDLTSEQQPAKDLVHHNNPKVYSNLLFLIVEMLLERSPSIRTTMRRG